MPKHLLPWTENHRIQYHGPKTIAFNTMDQKPSHPKTCAKIMHKTIGGSTHPNIGSKNKIFWGAALDPIEWAYGYPSNPLWPSPL